jgi:uncharacterized protein (TIGR02001 family)
VFFFVGQDVGNTQKTRGNAVMTRRVSAQSSRNGLICEPTNRTGFPNAVLDRGSGGSDVVRLLAVGVVLSTSLVIGTPRCAAAGQWGGSLDITSDYIVRGISRSNEQAALQLDLHYTNTSGFMAGLFASNTQIDPDAAKDVELDAFVGYQWTVGSDWRGKILASHYAYPWNQAGSGYDYDELDVDLAFQDWVSASLVYSPNAVRFLRYRGLIGVASESAEVNLQRPVVGKLYATGGIGYSRYEGPDPTDYTYWSVGAVYTIAPVSLALSYVDTTAGAKALFYNDAAGGRWVGTIIWRF